MEYIIVINIPSGLTVHPAPGNRDGTLVNGLLYHCKDLENLISKVRGKVLEKTGINLELELQIIGEKQWKI